MKTKKQKGRTLASPARTSARAALANATPLAKLMEKHQVQAFNKLTSRDWTVEDWADLKFAMDWVVIQVALRHGILCDQHPCPLHPSLPISGLNRRSTPNSALKMQFVAPIKFEAAIQKLGARSPIGAQLSSQQWSAVPVALRERALWSATIESLRFGQDLAK
jgi:hypothetical protein